MGAEKIGGTSSPGPTEEQQHKKELAEKGKGTTILPDIEVDYKESTTGKTEVTYDNTLLKEKYGENPSRTNLSGYITRTLKTHYTQKKINNGNKSLVTNYTEKPTEKSIPGKNKSLETRYTVKPKSGK